MKFFTEILLESGEKVVDSGTDTSSGELLTINSQRRRVAWYSKLGCRLLKSVMCTVAPMQAIFCEFQLSSGISAVDDATTAKQRTIRKGIAILLSPTELHVHLLSGEQFKLQLKLGGVKKITALPVGILLQCDQSKKAAAATAGKNNSNSKPVDEPPSQLFNIPSFQVEEEQWEDNVSAFYSLVNPSAPPVPVLIQEETHEAVGAAPK